MKLLNKIQFKKLMKQYPHGGIVFAECSTNNCESNINGDLFELQVTDGDFGATMIVPIREEVFDYDWNIEEYEDTDMFAVYDNNDVLQMIQTLSKGLIINLSDNYENELNRRKTGKWIPHGKVGIDGNQNYSCSICGAGECHAIKIKVPYCWNCGSVMIYE